MKQIQRLKYLLMMKVLQSQGNVEMILLTRLPEMILMDIH